MIANTYCDCFSIARDRFEVAGENSDDYKGIKETVTSRLKGSGKLKAVKIKKWRQVYLS